MQASDEEGRGRRTQDARPAALFRGHDQEEWRINRWLSLVSPDIQWQDDTGAPSPTGVWYYQVTAYNANCAAKGPF